MNTNLTNAQVEHFIEYGFLHLPHCFDTAPGSTAHRWLEESWKRNGLDPNDLASWPLDKIHMPNTESEPIREFAPAAWNAICGLCGGEDRLVSDQGFGNGFIVNFGWGRDLPWVPAGPEAGGWHKDGDFFLHFLDSPEQGLLIVVYYSDVEHQGGGTFIAPDSIGVVARYLAEHPEGIHPFGFPQREQSLIRKCRDFREVTGQAGDVFLLHPYMLHASSRNHLNAARFMTNPCIRLRQPMVFNRSDGSATSPIESAVLRGLGVESYNFQPDAPRCEVVPPRIAEQRELLRKEEERKRKLASAG